MYIFSFYVFFVLLIFKININSQDDIFELNKNLRFCGVDLLSYKISYAPKNDELNTNNNLSSDIKYQPIRIFIESTYFEYQASFNPELLDIIPILKSALDSSVEAIKSLIEVEDKGNINLFNFIDSEFFSKYQITKWSSIFDNKNSNINSDLLIIMKFDTDIILTQGIIASSDPIILDHETNRPLVAIITITKETNIYSRKRINEYLRLVFLHELFHALGFSKSMFDYFPQGKKGTYTTEIIRNVNRTIIITPKVVEIAKKYYNCSNLKGVELEDQGGKDFAFSHWDQRILLGDLMGGLFYQEEMAISEITLALLEDSGWYKVNYYTGGLMRFGKNKGCAFLENNCLDENFNTEFDNEFFDLNENMKPSCSAGRQSRTYSVLKEYNKIMDLTYKNNFIKIDSSNTYKSGNMFTSDYCFTHGEILNESNNEYFTGNCLYGSGNYGNYIKYINNITKNEETGHSNSEFPEKIGEIYSNTSFCIMSSLTPIKDIFDDDTNDEKFKLFNSIPHPICYKVYCSSTSLTIQINNNFIICPREGGNIIIEGYDGFIHCPDYNLICTGTVVCNDIFDCIEKKSSYKNNTFNYDYKPVTTQKFSEVNSNKLIFNNNYELSEDGFCPIHCAQCNIYKKCKKCKGGYNLIGKEPLDDEPIVCDNTIDINSTEYYKLGKVYYKCNEECDGCIYFYDNCILCKENYYFLNNENHCYKKGEQPIGYYFNEESNKFESCNKFCKTCSAGSTSDKKMNCDSCIEGFEYDKETKNCKRINVFRLIWLTISIIIFIFVGTVLCVLVVCFRNKTEAEKKKLNKPINIKEK